MKQVRKILIVDDDDITCYISKFTLQEMMFAHEVEHAPDGSEALAYIREHCSKTSRTDADCPDLILVDINMPGMDGFHLLEAMQQDRSLDLERIYVVIITTSDRPKDMQKAASYGSFVKGFLSKPLQAADLEAVLAQSKPETGLHFER